MIMYYINPSAYTGVAPVPAEIIKKLKTASGNQLRVILAVCSCPAAGAQIGDIAAVTGLTEDEAEDCLEFWSDNGILMSGVPEKTLLPARTVQTDGQEESSPAGKPSAEAPRENKSIKPPSAPFSPEKPTRAQIAQRLNESAELRDLLNDVQKMLGRTLGNNDLAILVLLHDYYGLRPEIIIMICEYARLHGKANNMAYIKTMGVNWSTREIDTVEAASAELNRLEAGGKIWSDFLAATGNIFPAKPTEKQRETVTKWVERWALSPAVITLACEEMTNNGAKPNVAYMDKVLGSWVAAGATTPEKIAELKKKYEDDKLSAAGTKKRTPPKDSDNGNTGASYDIAQAVAEAETGELIVRKRKRK